MSEAMLQAAIRHRNLAYRAFLVLLGVGGAIAVAAALTELWWSASPAEGTDGLWPDLATLALGYFSLAVSVALTMAGVYEVMVMRHLRAIARQVRSGAWLSEGQAVGISRGRFGTNDDIDAIVGALNEARDHGIETRSALTWHVGQRRSAEAEIARKVRALEATAARLERETREQADFAWEVSQDMRGTASTIRDGLGADPVRPAGGGNVLPLHGRSEGGLAAAVERLASLIDDIGDHAAAATGRTELEPVALEDVVRGVVNDLRHAIAAAGARVEISGLPVVRGDRGLLARLFRDLIGNALRHPDPARPLAIRVMACTDEGEGRATVIVRDTGISVEPDGQEAATAPVRLSDGRKVGDARDRSFTLCRRIAIRHGGDISARPAPGGGAMFEMRLDLA